MSNPNVLIDRNKYIGGSDLPTILGLNAKYDINIFEFAKEKLGIIPKSFKGNEYTRYGQIMEPVIRDYINAIYQSNYKEATVIDEERKLRGNTDGIDITADIPIIEIKTFGNELDLDYYTPQCQFYMETFNQDKCLLVGYKRPDIFYTGVSYDLENEDKFFDLNFNPKNIELHFIGRNRNQWNMIYSRITAFQNALNILKENNNMTEEEFNQIFYGTDLITMTNKISKLETQLNTYKELEKEYKKLKDDLYKVFDERGILSFDTGKVKITKVNPTSYTTETIDTAKLKMDLPDLYEEYKQIKRTNKKGYILITKKGDK